MWSSVLLYLLVFIILNDAELYTIFNIWTLEAHLTEPHLLYRHVLSCGVDKGIEGYQGCEIADSQG